MHPEDQPLERTREEILHSIEKTKGEIQATKEKVEEIVTESKNKAAGPSTEAEASPPPALSNIENNPSDSQPPNRLDC